MLNNWRHTWNSVPGSIEEPEDDRRSLEEASDLSDITDIDDEFGRNAQLALHATVSQLNRTTYHEADKPKGELLFVIVEALATLGLFIVSIIALKSLAWGRGGNVAAVVGVVMWGYVLVLTSIRLASSYSNKLSFPSLWYHTAFLYGFHWPISVLLFRSYILHPRSRLSQLLMILIFVFNTVLFLIALGSRKGNKAVDIEYEGDIPPAREPTASLLSLATFSWVDKIVWTGYKKTFELQDVCNLAKNDKAATVLSNYRQVKKTSLLAWHLLKFFKHGLLTQAFWACMSGLLTFAPTILLREILQYVENPQDIPRNTAWFFVILLFVCGCASALCDGQALWIGRHTCIRLRAVIVGEVYAKALKRKVGASGDKILGENKPTQSKSTFLGKLNSFGRKKQDIRKTQSQEDQKPVEVDSQVTSGTIINLMAVDSFKVSEVSAYLHFLWATTPVQVIMAVVLLYNTLGFSSIAGISMMFLLLPVNMYIANRFAAIQKKILAATDARIHTTNEVLTNIRIIKYFAWEQRFIDAINEKRVTELKHLRTRYILWATAATVWSGAPILITLLSFAVYTYGEKKDLIPSVAFTALSLFQILRIPLDQLADMVAHVQESKVSVDRIEEFLNEEDTQKYKQLRHSDAEPSNPTIGFSNGIFTWGTAAKAGFDITSAFRLMDLDMRFEVGQLNIVAGPTGSGKTSLLMALLGEMTLLNGSVYLPGARSREDISRDPNTGLAESVAYCAQQAWLVNGTVKQNIVFASPWDQKRYDQVIKSCALAKDLEILDGGDDTLVGEKGVTLSGGQKQRISLARALYCNARHVLLDDILSAVDSHTAKWIFDEALRGPLMYNRTCILVTHNVSLCLPHAEFVVLLDNGKVSVQGSPDVVINSGRLDQNLTQSTHGSKAPSRVPSTHDLEDLDRVSSKMNGSASAMNGATKRNPSEPSKASQAHNANILQESKAVGMVKISIITMYLKSMGSWIFWIFAAFAFAGQQVSSVSTNVWIREWANAYAYKDYTAASVHSEATGSTGHGAGRGWAACLTSRSCAINLPFAGRQDYRSVSLTAAAPVDAGYYLGVYGALGAIFLVITFLREIILFAGSLNASKSIHKKLINSVSHAKFRFFDSTPLGQMMNRFSKDIENVDQEIAPVAVGVIHCLATIITIVVLISVITPGFLIAGIFITILYFLIGKFYINSSRDLKRIESVQRSPLYQQFGETLAGMTTIRAYGDERRFIRDNLAQVNTHNRPFIYLWAANRWLAFRVDIAGALVSFFAGVFVVLSVGQIDAGAAGLALSYAVTFTENVLWFVRLYATNEQNMNSVERIKEYLDVEQEAAQIIPESRPPSNWPDRGAVEFVGYSTRYRKDFDLVLRDLTFKIAAGEKIGVVGRTGAGKSSLALALFRALEAESGKILIDDVDTGLIGLQDLREAIVMVPQDPTLFTGTIRSNLDPFGLFTDEEIFTALRRVQLIGSIPSAASSTSWPSTPLESTRSSIPALPSSTALDSPTPSNSENKNIFLNLLSPVAESGNNLSQGQRQLLCLARALLKAPKVLLMDEATASIDYATDAKVQATIRELQGNTIITIAHRLKTIVDYDKVIVMERGRLVEMGSPWELLRPIPEGEPDRQRHDDDAESVDKSHSPNKKRWFREMCETSGDLENLEHEAKRSWESKRLVDDT